MSIIPNDIHLNSFLDDKDDDKIHYFIKENQDL